MKLRNCLGDLHQLGLDQAHVGPELLPQLDDLGDPELELLVGPGPVLEQLLGHLLDDGVHVTHQPGGHLPGTGPQFDIDNSEIFFKNV